MTFGRSAPAALVALLLAVSAGIPAVIAEDAITFESWDFRASGNILAMSTLKDVTGDGVDDLVVAALDRSVYLVDGVSGEKVWSYTANKFYNWHAIASWPAIDADVNGKSDVVVSTKDRLVMLLDGAKGKQLWAFNVTDSLYTPGGACSLSLRSIHIASDIDGDGVPDVVAVSGTGDSCAQNDKFTVLALSAKDGETLWEYVHDEDYHGLKDGTVGSSPAVVIDFNNDGTRDVAVADDQGSLHVVNGLTGSELRSTKIGVFGAIWNFVEIPDISADGQPDAIAFEFIDGEGGPDYASIDAIDLVKSRVIWQAKIGDGLYNSGALYSGAWMNDAASSGASSATTYFAVTQRIHDALDLVLLDIGTGQQIWKFRLGEEQSRNDLEKRYPVARIADSSGGNNDELAVGSIDSKLHLLDPASGATIWSHPINGEISGITFIGAHEGQKYILVEDVYFGIRALSRQTTIPTELSIESSSKTVIESSRLVITGTVSPPFPGEIVHIRYVDPSGSVTTKTLVLDRDGTYTDVIEPEKIGSWKVSAEFKGEGFYLDSKSPTIDFTVIEEVEASVFTLRVRGDNQAEISYPILYHIDGGQVTAMGVDKEERSLEIAINPMSPDGGLLMVELPRSVIDAAGSSFQVLVDGRAADFEEIKTDSSMRSLSIPFEENSNRVVIIGTYIVPEFSSFAPALLAAVMALVLAVGMRGRLNLRT